MLPQARTEVRTEYGIDREEASHLLKKILHSPLVGHLWVYVFHSGGLQQISVFEEMLRMLTVPEST